MKKTLAAIVLLIASVCTMAAFNAASVEVAPTTAWVYGPAGGITQLPAGDVTLTDTLVIENQFGPTIQGAGRFRTRIIWKGPAGKPVIAFRSCDRPVLQDLTIHCFTPCRSVVCISTSPKPSVTNTAALIQRCWFECSNNANECIEINNVADGGSDNNGEHHRVSDCQINDFKKNGVGIYCSQSHRCVIENCQFKTSSTPGAVGVYARVGSQTMRGCSGYGLDLVFYGSDQFAGAGVVTDNNFENCKRFIFCGVPNATWIVERNRCDGMLPYVCNYGDNEKVAVRLTASGSTTFRDNIFGCYNGGSVQVVFVGAIGLNCSGNSFTTNNTTPCPTLTMVQGPVQGPIASWNNNRWTQFQTNGTQPIKQLVMPKNTNIGLVQAAPQ